MAEIIEKTGKSYNIFDKINNVWNKCSFWTHSNDVFYPDGKSATTKHSAINGITSDLSGEAEDIAASIKCVNQLNSSLTTRYNTETGFLEVNIDGTWIETIYINPNEPTELIPVLTENTTNVSSSYNAGNTSEFEAYKAFDGNSSTRAKPYSSAPISNSTLYVQYDFQKLVTISKVSFIVGIGSGGSISTTKGSVSILISEDNSTWEEVWNSGTQENYSVNTTVELANAKKARYIRLRANITTAWSFSVYTLQAYGLK